MFAPSSRRRSLNCSHTGATCAGWARRMRRCLVPLEAMYVDRRPERLCECPCDENGRHLRLYKHGATDRRVLVSATNLLLAVCGRTGGSLEGRPCRLLRRPWSPCPALTSMCWPWSTSSSASTESSPMPSMRPTSWGSARNRRARTGREAVEMAGVVLGYRASWHDRGPGGRHDDGARSRGRGHPHPKPA